MFLPCLTALLLLSAQPINGSYVRRMPEKSEDSPPLIPPGFGLDNAVPVSQGGPELDQTIRNGHAIAALPWYAVFQSRTLCGGSLIHGDILLTASHCVDDNGLPERVRVGSSDYWRGGRVTKVKGGVLHPGWTWHRASDPDLAVLVLEDFLPNEVAILNSDNSIPVADHPSLFAMGFGLKNDKQTSRDLLGASIPYLDNCSYRSYTYEHHRHLCCDSAHIATCGGDSGSPITLGPTSRLQVGINSYSNGKCSTQTLDVYTRVSFFYDWIQQQVCDLSSNPPERCFETPVPTPVPTMATPLPTVATPMPTVATPLPTVTTEQPSVTTEQPSEPTSMPSASVSTGETDVATSPPTTATPTATTIPAGTVAPTKEDDDSEDDGSDDGSDDDSDDDSDESPATSPPSPAETSPPTTSTNTGAPTIITPSPSIATTAPTIATAVPTTAATTTLLPTTSGTSAPTLNATAIPTP